MAKVQDSDEKLKAKVRQQLKERGVSGEEAPKAETTSAPAEGAASYSPPSPGLFQRTAKKPEVAMFFREFSILVESGYPILRALNLLSSKITNRHLADTLGQVALQVEKGSTLSKAMASYPWYFTPMILAMVEAGESGGELVEALNSIADDFESNEDLTDKMVRALSYPLLTAGIAILAFLGILVFTVPTFADVYKKHNMELPTSTALLVALSTILTHYWWLWLPLLVLAGWALWKKFLPNLGALDGLLLRIPVLGEILVLGSMARFSSSLRILLSNGVPLLHSLTLARNTINNRSLAAVVDRMRQSAESGKSLAQPLAESGLFPALMVDMLFVGEESGKLPFVLEQIAKSLRMRLDRITNQLAVTLGPVMTLVVGVLVLLIALSLFVPYFNFISMLGEIKA